MDINTLAKTYLQGLGYTSASLPDLWREAFQDISSSSLKALPDLWKEFLSNQGYVGDLPTALYQYLGSLGYSGSLDDRMRQSLIAEDFFAIGPVSCAHPLDATEAALQAAGFTGRLSLSNNDQTGTRTFTSGNGLWAMASSVGQQLDFSVGHKACQLNIDSFDDIVTSGNATFDVNFYDTSFSGIVYGVGIVATTSGFQVFVNEAGSISSVSSVEVASRDQLGMSFNASTGYVTLKANHEVLAVTPYTPQALIPIISVAQNALHADNAGNSVTGTWITQAASITQADLGTTDPCGNEIPIIQAPGYYEPFGLQAMTVSDLTVTCPDSNQRGASISQILFPTGTDVVVMEVHYDPADWAGGPSGIGVGITPTFVDLTEAGPQSQTSLVLVMAVVGGTKYTYVMNSDATAIYGQADIATLTHVNVLAASYHPGSELTFVIDEANMNVTKAQLDTAFGGPGRDYFDIFRNPILTS